MPSFAALTSLVLLAASDLVAAQISAPNCSLLWEWSFNSLGQNACTVAAYLMSTCNSGAFNISPLPSGFWYTGPAAAEGANTCKCNTVAYNLVSACDGCQAEIWISWVEYSTNCTAILAPSTFPNAVPEGTRVPHWALMDPTLEGFWDLTASLHAGDSPEVMPGSFISASTPTSTLAAGAGGHATSTITTKSGVAGPSSDPESKSRSGSSSSTATIAGGVVGGVVALAIIGAVLFYFLRKRRLSRTPSATFVVDPDMPIQLSVSQMGQVAFPSDEGSTYAAGTPVSPVKLYDPNDPYTYPGYQRVSTTDAQVPAMPYETGLNGNTLGGNTMGGNTLGGNTLNGNTVGRNTLANRQTTHPVGGYHGLPTI